jgi:hypothetical protein
LINYEAHKVNGHRGRKRIKVRGTGGENKIKNKTRANR